MLCPGDHPDGRIDGVARRLEGAGRGRRARGGEARGRPADGLHENVDVLAGEPYLMTIIEHKVMLLRRRQARGDCQ